MANPVLVVCPEDTWTKVITGLTAASIRFRESAPTKYLWTYIATTGAAPTDLSFGASADVYIYPIGADGEVRIDT